MSGDVELDAVVQVVASEAAVEVVAGPVGCGSDRVEVGGRCDRRVQFGD
jgi:hypothetical protein